jgi:uncharacterized membrane protein YdbT with pleckstrin-like domain
MEKTGSRTGEDDIETSSDPDYELVLINEIQLLLEEKRTSLAVMRTGIAILIIQLLISSFLIATSKSYQFLELIQVTIPFLVINIFLLVLASYLIISSLIHIRHYDRVILRLKKHRRISDLMG